MPYKKADVFAEEGLVLQAASGDALAFNQLADNWHGRIYNFALRYLGDHDEAMEVSQQTFIKAWKNIGQLRDGSQFRAWLYVIAGNTCRDSVKRAAKRKTVSFEIGKHDQVQEGVSHAERHLLQTDHRKMLQEAIRSLPEEQRIVLIMKEYEGLKFVEIAGILNASESTIKSRLYYAFKAMRRMLEPYQKEEL